MVTKKSEEFSLARHSWIPTVGHQSLIKRVSSEMNFILYMGGHQSSRVFGYSAYLFCQGIGMDSNEIWLEELSYKKPNQITSHSAGSSMTGSLMKNLSNFRWVDTKPPEDPSFSIFVFGGENIESGLSESDLYVLTGKVSPLEVHCRKYTKDCLDISGIQVPKRNLDLSQSSVRYIQNGEHKPGSRYGHCLLSLDPDTLFTFGGIRVERQEFLYLKESLSDMFLLKTDSLKWTKLTVDQEFQRVDFCAEVLNDVIAVVGGYRFHEHKPCEVFTISNVKLLYVNQQECSVTVKTILLEISDPHQDIHLYGSSSCVNSDILYVYGGFSPKTNCSNIIDLSLRDWHYDKEWKEHATLNVLYEIRLDSTTDSLQGVCIPGGVNSPVGGGSLLAICEPGFISLLSVGGSISDIWLYTRKPFGSTLCQIDGFEGASCKFTDRNFLVDSTLWVKCFICKGDYHAVCDARNKNAHRESVMGVYKCIKCKGNKDGKRVPSVAASDDTSEEEDTTAEISGDQEETLVYCFCRQPAYIDNMIGCDGDDCKIEWFHYRCVKVKRKPRGSWFCTDCKP